MFAASTISKTRAIYNVVKILVKKIIPYQATPTLGRETLIYIHFS
jgi:hypothetical protein